MPGIKSLIGALMVPLIAGCGSVPPAPAAKAELAPTGVLRVAVFTGNPVIGSKSKATGELAGTTVSLGNALAQSAGVPVRLIEYTAVAKMVEDARAGVWDIAVVAFDPARRNVLDFASPHIVVDLTYLIAPGATIASAAAVDQPGVRVAVARGAATALLLERTLKQATLTPAENEPAAFELIKQGKAQAYAQNRYMLLGLADGLPGARVVDDSFAEASMCIVLPKGRAAALAYVNEFVAQARSAGVIARAIADADLRGVNVAPGEQ
jgi:polar amino acid transport system substrate-binding protein